MKSKFTYVKAIAIATGFTLAPLTSAALPCETKVFTGPRDLQLVEDYKPLLVKIPASELQQILWGEMTTKEPKKSVAIPILNYLADQSSENRVMLGYYKALALMVLKDRDLQTAARFWPSRIAQTTSEFDLKELCELHQETLAVRPSTPKTQK